MSAATLAVGALSVTLPEDLHWEDEFAWQPVEQAVEYTLAGGVIVDTYTRQAGRPITLAGDDNRGWCSRAVLDQLAAWAATPGQELTLTLRGVERSVVFRHHAGPALDARPLLPGAPIDTPAGGTYVVTLRLMEI